MEIITQKFRENSVGIASCSLETRSNLTNFKFLCSLVIAYPESRLKMTPANRNIPLTVTESFSGSIFPEKNLRDVTGLNISGYLVKGIAGLLDDHND